MSSEGAVQVVDMSRSSEDDEDSDWEQVVNTNIPN